uniref:Alkyl transferase n=1 Tax=Culicoides sonorensis TaxID=179676 RepID=A0A336KQR1_CULSO
MPSELGNSSWVRESKLNWYERLAVNVVKIGNIPRHVAFIMDGNRRFATKAHIESREGHAAGFDKLSETLQWCLDLGIQEVTVYAFSIENFKRNQDEVDSLMSLAREKFQKLLDERDKLHERGICIRIIGNMSLLPKDILKTMAEAVLLTKDNKTAILNVAFAYTSRDEITNTIKTLAAGVKDDAIQVQDINETLFNECLYTNKSPNPDLLVRTSGEVRFSDFLLWQSSSSVVYFTDALWPEFTFWHLIGAIIYYQRHCPGMKKVQYELRNSSKGCLNTKSKEFIEKVNISRENEWKACQTAN